MPSLLKIMSLKKSFWYYTFLHFLLIVVSTTLVDGQNLTKQNASDNSSITAIFIFGDSTVDPGNNDYIQTLFKSDFPPYGVDFPDQTSTGRFTNGRLPTDFIASYLGAKEIIPAYLDPNLSMEDLITGVSFASAGTGYDPKTAERNKVMNLEAQLKYFDEYKTKLEQLVGKKRMEHTIEHAAYIISCGTNDIVYTFGSDFFPLVPEKVASYLQLMLNQSKWFIEGMKAKGAKRIAVVGLPPVGCLPIMMTLHPSLYQPRSCIQSLSSMAIDFNTMLIRQLEIMQASQPNLIMVFADIYRPLQDQFNNPFKYGFEEVNKGCCGTGLFEGSYACNSFSPICEDRSKYVFWDAIHPTERSYYLVFQALLPTVDLLLQGFN